jgi:hypothetical protein
MPEHDVYVSLSQYATGVRAGKALCKHSTVVSVRALEREHESAPFAAESQKKRVLRLLSGSTGGQMIRRIVRHQVAGNSLCTQRAVFWAHLYMIRIPAARNVLLTACPSFLPLESSHLLACPQPQLPVQHRAQPCLKYEAKRVRQLFNLCYKHTIVNHSEAFSGPTCVRKNFRLMASDRAKSIERC